eukprot:c6007_g1_i2.p1 GENE.c6007_g1_i2~~c6007_g1_i2.p1  ORF type:complete len:116 (+),score=24.16 c6007_g1_i2:149-496(+)
MASEKPSQMFRRPLLVFLFMVVLALGADEIVIGTDLVTIYSCVVYDNGREDHRTTKGQGNRVTPSYVTFTESERLLGDATKNQAVTNRSNALYEAFDWSKVHRRDCPGGHEAVTK